MLRKLGKIALRVMLCGGCATAIVAFLVTTSVVAFITAAALGVWFIGVDGF